MIELLLRARHVAFVGVLVLLAALVAGGRRVGYEQSIKSFFADGDPLMATYQKAAASFGDPVELSADAARELGQSLIRLADELE